MFSPSKPRELLPKDKFDLERATALVSTGYPTVAPILPDILGWLQDGNWPVAKVLAPFLASIGAPLAEEIRRILQTQDHLWKYWVLLRVIAHSSELATTLHPELLKIAESNPVDKDEKEVKAIAREILMK
ncbi:MAG TPA: DUF5071 domain-containing protein [Blastocatellia bacterium]